ncbi:NDMA-dependent alcohol dehydrogenase [Rhodococcus sp. 14-2483-1-2]|uniref:NDMA-dependent alcohol dehydrogenase n=1 Tax=Rhodococcus sp. 14-2483-1-2 TaxID=2023147 RepID=UPI000B9B67D5|nr:NDMA-dependent alcohol dehydrogenase [Rhodococcus sp. 14-2483-1-2]OZF39565.1 alcohol dehydrogenase [Rhodococcus sp. 14-2483-1-2]
MKTKGAILRGAPGKFETAEIELEKPRTGELLIRMAAAGLCHSDDHMATGDIPAGSYPLCGGHEGAGIVEEIGPSTLGWEVGDHVVFSFVPACGHCHWCAIGKQNLCDLGANMLAGTRFEDTTSYRMSIGDEPVGQMCGLSTFSEYTTVSVNSAVRVDKSLPLDKLSLLGCGVGTGWGSAVNAGQVGPSDTVIVMGVGGIGTSAVQGAAHAGARDVIAVDPVAFKRETALKLGATHAVASIDEANELARTLTNGAGADVAIVTVGVTTGQHIGQAIGAIRKAGIVVATGAGPATVSDVPINLLEFTMSEKKLVGALYGQSSPMAMIPRLADLYSTGHLKLDEMITQTYTLDQIAQGFEDMHAGSIIRGVVLFD